MTQQSQYIKKGLLQNCLNWFQVDFRESIVSLVEGQFPNYPLPKEIQSVLDRWEQLRLLVDAQQSKSVDVAHLCNDPLGDDRGNAPFFKQIILRYYLGTK